MVRCLVCLAVDEFNHHFALTFCEFFHHGLILCVERFLELLQIGVFLLLGVESFEILVGLLQCAVDEFGVGQCAFHVAHGAPVEFFFVFVAESLVGIHHHGAHLNLKCRFLGVVWVRNDAVAHIHLSQRRKVFLRNILAQVLGVAQPHRRE